MRKLFLGLILGILVLAGCFPGFSPISQSINFPNHEVGLLNQSSTATITSNQLIDTTSTPFPTNNLQPFETPTIQPSLPIYTAVQLNLPRPSNQVNILLLGSDYRPKKGFNTDVIMVLSLNLDKGTATLTSFPRDLYVDIPNYGMNRINAAQAIGGFELTAATLQENFDVIVDYYIMTNFSGFKYIVDALGGITVEAGMELNDSCALPQAVDRMCRIPVGKNQMNGATALWYVRSRETTNDFDRTRRAQEVITAIFKKAMTLEAINRGPELYDLFKSYVETDLPMDIVLHLLPISAQIIEDPSLVKRYTIGPDNIIYHTVPESGAMVLIPDPVSVSEIIMEAFYQYSE